MLSHILTDFSTNTWWEQRLKGSHSVRFMDGLPKRFDNRWSRVQQSLAVIYCTFTHEWRTWSCSAVKEVRALLAGFGWLSCSDGTAPSRVSPLPKRKRNTQSRSRMLESNRHAEESLQVACTNCDAWYRISVDIQYANIFKLILKNKQIIAPSCM